LVIAVSRNTVLGRGPFRKSLAGAFNRVHEGAVDCSLWGSPVRLHPARNVSERKALMRPDRIDVRELRFLAAQMGKPGSVLVDVGANAGLYSLYAALHAGSGARILAIEPAADMVARLQFNVALARGAGRIDETVEVVTATVAVGDADGEARLSGTDEGSRSLLGGAGTPVRLRRLSALLGEHGVGRIDVMKIDVEGYEDRVLPPYLGDVRPDRWPRAVILEHLSRARWGLDCIADCRGRGYEVLFVTRNNTVLALPA
jgi:FkbM family methyltransferase